MENINDNIRRIIHDNLLCKTGTANITFLKGIMASSLLKSKKNEVISHSFLSVIFLDTYKEIIYKLRHQNSTNYERQLYSKIVNFTSFDDIKNFFLKNEDTLFEGLSYSYNFYKYSDLKKINEVKILSESDNIYLNTLAPIHSEDLNKYTPVITKELLNEIYDDNLSSFASSYSDGSVFSDDPLIIELSGFLLEQSYYNFNDVCDTLSSISSVVFSNLERLSEKLGTNQLVSKDVIDEYNDNPADFISGIIDDADLDFLDSILNYYYSMRILLDIDNNNNNKNKKKIYKKD